MKGKLGFGLMRLPRKGISIDIKETCEMIDMFIDRGFNYFDTAHIYPGSEVAAQKALFSRHDRESFTIATKLFAPVVPTKKMAENEFYESLKRMKTDYIDYYLLHFLNDMNYKKYERFELWDFVQKRKDEGKIKHIGFSFHGGPEVLDEILSAHPEVAAEYCFELGKLICHYGYLDGCGLPAWTPYGDTSSVNALTQEVAKICGNATGYVLFGDTAMNADDARTYLDYVAMVYGCEVNGQEFIDGLAKDIR